ncbi:zf-HC2 domain-containing protein [Nocardiopsis synnemataformans]|uniref:anti-sigma factor family protein n=1 Tax=Nocardiopsis synnemataformans TaxID=61305 RepID=UPI003EBD7B7E
MNHLGERLSALIDGELGPVDHESALIHLAKCESCRFEADMMRRLKRRLHGLCEPEPDMDFMGRLTSLSRDHGPSDRGPSGPSVGGNGFGSSPPLGSSRPLGGFPGGALATAPPVPGGTPPATGTGAPATGGPDASRPERAAGSERRRRGDRLADLFPTFPGGRYAVAGFAVATALLGSAFVAGGDTEETPVVEPRLADYAVEHALTSRNIPVVDARPTAAEAPHGPTETTR